MDFELLLATTTFCREIELPLSFMSCSFTEAFIKTNAAQSVIIVPPGFNNCPGQRSP